MAESDRVLGHSSRTQGNTAGQNKSSEGGLRKFRMDRNSAVKQQVSLLRYFRSEDKKSPGSPNKQSSQKNNPDSESISRSESPVLHRRMAVASPLLAECKSMVRPGESNSHFKTITTNKLSLRTLSKPVFVGAPSPEPSPEREEEEEEEEDTEVIKDDEEEGGKPSTSQESEETTSTRKLLKDFRLAKMKKNQIGESLAEEPPLGSVSTKTLINNMKRALNSPESDGDEQDENMTSNSSNGDQGNEDITEVEIKEKRGESSSSEEPPGDTSLNISVNKLKRMLSSSDLDPESQDSPVIRIKSSKRARLLASSDEEEDDDDPSVKKKQLNGHSTSDSEGMPDGESIDKFLDMWETVYTYIPKMEFLDIFRAHDWNVKNTMIKLGQLNKEYKVWQRQQKVEEEHTRKKEAAVKKEELEKFKQAGRDLEADARKSMKEKLKAQKESQRTKPSHKDMDAVELEEEEGDDYQFCGTQVYNSESDDEEEGEDEDDPRLKGDRDLVLQFFNDASIGELSCLGGCSKKKADLIVQYRPFKDWTQIVKKLKKAKQITPDILNQAKTVLHVRNTVQKLMKRCENIAKDMQYIVSNIVSGEEDAGISKQPEILNPEMQLKNYQLIGLNWLVLMHQQGLNGVLADEMGLGKTIQAISFLAYIKEVEAPETFSLIVVPSSTLENWARELEVWCPDLEVLSYHGSQEDRRAIRAEIINDTLEDLPDVILTTYNMVTTSTEDRALFKRLRFHTLILDEAHMLKNMASMRYENLMKIKAQRRVLLTGTPLQNNLVELMSILIFVMPQLFDSKKEELKRVFTMFPKSDCGSKSLFERERIDQAKRIMKAILLKTS